MTDYPDCLRAAGAEVHDYETFGDYQGIYVADVTWQGRRGYVLGYFGTCSGCDALAAESKFNEETGEYSVSEQDMRRIGLSDLNDTSSIGGRGFMTIEQWREAWKRDADWHSSEDREANEWIEAKEKAR